MKSCKKIHEFEIPEKPKIKLKYKNIKEYIENGIQSEPVNTYIQLNRFYRLLALREKECEDSRGYEFKYGGRNYSIYKDYSNAKKHYTFSEYYNASEDFFTVYFATIEDAELICNILNEDRFNLEGE